ncbi:MAG TPA: hypothetical protein VNY31_03340 [Solirubrobacteraceae bacterium]|nr:hypothetical protein [Solirubrobacteraceae bacterium]
MRGASPLAQATLAAFVVTLAAGGTAVTAAAAPPHGVRSPGAADSPRAKSPQNPNVPRAPSYPPLSAAGGATPEAPEARGSMPEADPLVTNGLDSPFCRGALGEGALPPARRRNCETSGFSAAGSPTANWGIDVHIDTGFLRLSSGGLLSVVQDLFVTPVWMALVWAVHALVVMVEWCFAIDLLDSPASGSVGRGLREMQSAFTEPWLAAVLAVAAVLALYNGLIRRRVVDTLGEALVMGAMMAGGMWLIADPAGTVGALGAWANQASLGTLAVSARGTPTRPSGALSDSMAALFASAIEAPWCYLEFGDVGWCRNPARLDSRLRESAQKLATGELAAVGCGSSSGPFASCVRAGSGEAVALERSATLLRRAQTNGTIFLALPANGAARNSINEQGSLLRTICQSSEATHCRGPTAAQAQFRTNGGTWSRVGGLLLIVAGVLGMLLLFGFIGLRLLGAAIFSLLYLLLAPAVILAPAFGEAGRAVFRNWAAHLLGAVVSKLLFSFLLGVVLAVLAILASLEGLGWWTQWLLMSAFWWGAYARRHQALAVAEGALGRQVTRERRVLRRGGMRRLEPPHSMRRLAGRARARFSRSRAETELRQGHPPADVSTASPPKDDQASRMLEAERREARRRPKAAAEIEARLAATRARVPRLREEREKALADGDSRRAAELAHRTQRVEAEIEKDQHELDGARRLRAPDGAAMGKGDAVTPGPEGERVAFLDQQASLPRGLPAAASTRRDYPQLAYLVGIGRGHYLRMGPRERRETRLEIDRELALRGGGRPAETPLVKARPAPPRPDPRPDARGTVGGSIGGAPGGGRGMRGSDEGSEGESSVMRDAREVAARRKRQLGTNRP